MGFFDFIEQHHAVRLAAHSLGELAAFLITHISRRRADQAADGIFLHIFAHVDAHDVLFVIEQRFRQCFGKLRFAHARRA